MRCRNPRLGRVFHCSGAAAAVHRSLVSDQHSSQLARRNYLSRLYARCHPSRRPDRSLLDWPCYRRRHRPRVSCPHVGQRDRPSKLALRGLPNSSPSAPSDHDGLDRSPRPARSCAALDRRSARPTLRRGRGGRTAELEFAVGDPPTFARRGIRFPGCSRHRADHRRRGQDLLINQRDQGLGHGRVGPRRDR